MVSVCAWFRRWPAYVKEMAHLQMWRHVRERNADSLRFATWTAEQFIPAVPFTVEQNRETPNCVLLRPTVLFSQMMTEAPKQQQDQSCGANRDHHETSSPLVNSSNHPRPEGDLIPEKAEGEDGLDPTRASLSGVRVPKL